MELTVPLLTWSIIVVIIAVMAVATFVHKIRLPRRRIFEIGSEREELFIPGDRLRSDIRDYDIDE